MFRGFPQHKKKPPSDGGFSARPWNGASFEGLSLLTLTWLLRCRVALARLLPSRVGLLLLTRLTRLLPG